MLCSALRPTTARAGRDTLTPTIAATRVGGRIHQVGYTADRISPLDTFTAIEHATNVRIATAGSRASFEALVGAMQQHAIRPVIDRSFDLEHLDDAIDYLTRGGTSGRFSYVLTFRTVSGPPAKWDSKVQRCPNTRHRRLGDVTEQAITTLTLSEFLTWEEHQPQRHELVGGRVYSMSGGTERHGLMTGHLFTLFAAGAMPKRCRAFQSDRKLQVASGDVYYPDVLVSCGKAADVQYESDATVVVEILSPSTRVQDRREKVRSYGTLPSISQYIVVEPDLRRVEVAHWGKDRDLSWATLGPGDQLHTAYGTWAIDDIYDAVDALATT